MIKPLAYCAYFKSNLKLFRELIDQLQNITMYAEHVPKFAESRTIEIVPDMLGPDIPDMRRHDEQDDGYHRWVRNNISCHSINTLI